MSVSTEEKTEPSDKQGISRRGFLGVVGAAAMAATIPVINTGCTPRNDDGGEGSTTGETADAASDTAPSNRISNTDIEEGSVDVSPVKGIGQGNQAFIHEHLDHIVEMLKDYPIATEDLTLPDGSVIDKAYVTMFNRYNHLGEGLNGTPGVGSFDLLTSEFSVEDAERWNTLPLFERFHVADWADTAGLSEDEAGEILDDFADRRLIDRFDREDGSLYFVTPYAGGIRIRLYRDFTPEVLRGCDTLRGVERNTTSQYPVYAVCPVGPEAVEGGEVLFNRDWRAQIEQSSVFTAQPCGCRNSAILKGEMEENEEGIRHCMVFGELAQYFIDSGHPPLTKQEVLDEADKLIDLGYVPEMVFAEHPDVMCFCKAERCTMLTAHRNSNGETVSFPHASGAYILDYDKDACIQCGSCVERCPMHSVSMDGEGYPVLDKACVGCGQCVLVCPANARLLKLKPEDEIPELPADLCEQTIWQAADRMATSRVVDFVGNELPEYAIEISEAANSERDAKYKWLIDTKPNTSVEGCADGTYTATRGGIQGPLTLTVEIASGRIASIEVGENKETETVGSVAIDEIPPAIVSANSLDVDVVSGATHTSIAIFKAVSDCLVEAGAV